MGPWLCPRRWLSRVQTGRRGADERVGAAAAEPRQHRPGASWPRYLALVVVTLIVALGALGHAVHAQTAGKPQIIAKIPVGIQANVIMLNPRTNMIYAEDSNHARVAVIDGATNVVTTTLALGGTSLGFGAVNVRTDRVYVTNPNKNLTDVIDGATNTLLPAIPAPSGDQPDVVGVNARTNRVYVVNAVGDSVSVVNGTTDRVIATVPVGNQPEAIAVNSRTNRIYVMNNLSQTVSVIDGQTNHVIATVPVGHAPTGIALDPVTNRIYVSNQNPDTVTAIDGASNTAIATITLPNSIGGGTTPAVDARTNRIYAADPGNPTWVIDGATSTVVATVGAPGISAAINPRIDHIYVGLNLLAVIDGTTNAVIADLPGGGDSTQSIAVNVQTGRVYTTEGIVKTVWVIQDQ